VCFNAPMNTAGSDLLRQVSRSFYLTLRVLPGVIRPQVRLAYMLARATDTIADTPLVSVAKRRAALREMRAAILEVAEGRSSQAPDFGELAAAQEAPGGRGSPAERRLLEKAAELLEALGALAIEDRRRISVLLEIITRGQETDLARFGCTSPEQIIALDADDDLEEYTYCVAGCVGEYWTRMCRAHLFPKADLDDTFLLASGIRFGKGLQLVNILRDLPGDLRQGRCYLPRTRLAAGGLEPVALLDTGAMGRFRPLYAAYLKQAKELLAAGWAYTNALPRSQMRVRLACAWPILIGMKTLARLRAANVLDNRHRVKVSRREVRGLILHSVLCCSNSRAWNRLFERAGEDEPGQPL
jgi:farnesyl-diphosphate farnesyltransferase